MKRILAAIGLTAAFVLGASGTASAGPVDPTLNHTSYWEMVTGLDCEKTEYSDGLHSVTVGAGETVIVKAGTAVTVYDEPGTYWVVKDISFIIVCSGGEEPPS